MHKYWGLTPIFLHIEHQPKQIIHIFVRIYWHKGPISFGYEATNNTNNIYRRYHRYED